MKIVYGFFFHLLMIISIPYFFVQGSEEGLNKQELEMTHNEALVHGSFVNPPHHMVHLALGTRLNSLLLFTWYLHKTSSSSYQQKTVVIFIHGYFVKNLYSLEKLLLCSVVRDG